MSYWGTQSPYFIGWSAGSWGTSWGDIPVDEGLEPAGHWKHLLRPIKAVDTPQVKCKADTYSKVAQPTTSRVLRVAADTPRISKAVHSICRVETPYFGTTTPNCTVTRRTKIKVKPPYCGGTTPFVRGRGWAVHGKVRVAQCGVTTPVAIGRVYGGGYVELPKTIKNPSLEMLAALI
jgi:hypothetical protein